MPWGAWSQHFKVATSGLCPKSVPSLNATIFEKIAPASARESARLVMTSSALGPGLLGTFDLLISQSLFLLEMSACAFLRLEDPMYISFKSLCLCVSLSLSLSLENSSWREVLVIGVMMIADSWWQRWAMYGVKATDKTKLKYLGRMLSEELWILFNS